MVALTGIVVKRTRLGIAEIIGESNSVLGSGGFSHRGLRWESWTKTGLGGRPLYSQERRRLAIETFIKFDHSYAGTVAGLGYPTRSALRAW